MDANALSAANAYRNQLKLAQEGGSAVQEEANKPAFSDLMEKAASNAMDSQYKSETLSLESLTGKVELSDLVTAITNAELTLNTVVAVRDRVINAYQDIIRMPI